MSEIQFKQQTLVLLAACLLLSGTAFGQTPPPPPASYAQSAQQARQFADKYRDYLKLRKRFEDPAFDRYVNLRQFGKAWNDFDSAALADVAFQLAYAEDVLQRQHKKLNADAALDVALKLAAEKQDVATLERLARAADHYGKAELAARIKVTTDLSLASRASVPELVVSVMDVSATGYAMYRSVIAALAKIKILEDEQGLDRLESSSLIAKLPEELKDYAQQQIARLRESMPHEKPEATEAEPDAVAVVVAEEDVAVATTAGEAATENDVAEVLRTLSAASRIYDAAQRAKPSN